MRKIKLWWFYLTAEQKEVVKHCGSCLVQLIIVVLMLITMLFLPYFLIQYYESV